MLVGVPAPALCRSVHGCGVLRGMASAHAPPSCPAPHLPAGLCRCAGGQGLQPAGHADWEVRGLPACVTCWEVQQLCEPCVGGRDGPLLRPAAACLLAHTRPSLPRHLAAERSTGRGGCCRPTGAPAACTTGWLWSALTLLPRWPTTCAARRWSSATRVGGAAGLPWAAGGMGRPGVGPAWVPKACIAWRSGQLWLQAQLGAGAALPGHLRPRCQPALPASPAPAAPRLRQHFRGAAPAQAAGGGAQPAADGQPPGGAG